MGAASLDDLVVRGRAALSVGDAAVARAIFEEAATSSSVGEVLEGLAQAYYLELRYQPAIDAWEQAFATYRGCGDGVSAVRIARTLAYMYFTVNGDRAIGGGWLARAKTLLVSDDGDNSQAGWVALNIGMFDGDRPRKEASFREALECARSFGDRDLEFCTLAYLGASMVHGDDIEQGMMLLDEALAAIAGGEVGEFIVLEEIFCQLFAACEHANDVARAEQWIRVGETIAERRNLPVISAFCRTHYGGVLTAAGRWPEADATLTEAARLWGLGQRSQLRLGALCRLADLRVHQGRFEEAEQLLEGVDPNLEPGAARPRAAIYLARGDIDLAADTIERALTEVEPTSVAAAPLLTAQVDILLAARRVEAASTAADRLAECALQHPSHFLVASAALARGRVLLASGGDPQACLREALAGFARAHMPIEVARSRLELASALVEDRPEVAMNEARAALEAFERLQAARDVDAATALLRVLGVRTVTARRSDSVLTRREQEVLELIGRGLSNPEISDRLYISRKTVEHHVGNILAKLGLRTRGEAAAYVSRTKPAER